MGDIDENIREILEKARVKMCEEDWYIDLILEQIWDDLPEKVKRPLNIPEIRRLIVERIDETREGFMREVGLIEDEDDEEEIIEYIINIDITDEVAGTVYSVQGGGPSYRDVVRELEEAAGSLVFYEHRHEKPEGGINYFSVKMEIYRNEKMIKEINHPNCRYKNAIQILRVTRYFMADIYNKDREEKGT